MWPLQLSTEGADGSRCNEWHGRGIYTVASCRAGGEQPMQWTANAPHTTQRFMYSMEKNVTKLSITLCLILLSITPCAPAIFA